MARTFSSGYIQASYSALGGYPFTMFVRANSTSNAAQQVAMALMVSSGNGYNGSLLMLDGAQAGDPALFSKFGGVLANSGGSYSVNTWHAVGGRANSTTALDVSLDGAQSAGASTSVAFRSPVSIQVGARGVPGIANAFAGACACVALWNVLLDDDELVSLAKGFSPRRIRPQSLHLYIPLVRDLIMLHWGVAATRPTFSTPVGSTSASDHPRSYGM